MSHTSSLALSGDEPIEGALSGHNTEYMGSAIGLPKLILRAEGLVVLTAACVFYAQGGYGWGTFALLFLVPDFSMVGYLVHKQLGSILYNVAHNYILPAALLAYGDYVSSETLVLYALIWISHVGFDRLLGYGLKYKTAFKHTHLSLPN